MEESKYFYDQRHQMDRWVGLNTTVVDFLAQRKRFNRFIGVTLLVLAGFYLLFW